jgi:hypothetical protein
VAFDGDDVTRDSDLSQCRLDLGEFDETLTADGAENLRLEYLAAKLATERKRCEFLEIRVQTARGKLVQSEDVERAMFAKGRIIRDGILNIPDRVAPLLLNKSDPGEIHNILMRELQEVLKELSRD